MENTSRYFTVKKDGVLIYIGDTEFFNRKIAGSLLAPEELLTKAISSSIEGIIIAKGSNAFKENFDKEFDIGDKVSFKGYFGQMYSQKKGEFQMGDIKVANRAYYRSLKDSEVDLGINKNE